MALRKIILVVENEVCGYLQFDDSFPQNATLADDFVNDSKFIEVDVSVPVQRKWIYDGINFIDPTTVG